jgi:chemotaxis protein histidine kinase CheA
MTQIAQANQRGPKRMQVRLEHLDKLLSLAGEVIITSANLQDMERRVQESVSRREALAVESLDIIKTSNESTRRISQDLHDLVMAIRLVEIGDTMRLFKRPVRDLARTLERDVELLFEGEETMIDKALADRLVDPLLHLLRNAVDHGIEPPLERAANHRPPHARVILKAEDLEHATRISVRDDGRGIDESLIRKIAEDSGVIDDANSVPLLDILCTPGFSSKSVATKTSGRGVGLDLVREMVDEFSGEFEIDTEPNKGAIFTMTIPKLRAVNIIDALTLSAGNLLFALPIHRIVASLGILREEIRNAFEVDRYIIYQGDTIPILDLLEILGEGACDEGRAVLPVVIVQNRTSKLALIVGEFLGPQKLVNIPFEDNISHARGIAGTTVFTGGKLGLTVDVDALLEDALHQTSGGIEKRVDLTFTPSYQAPPPSEGVEEQTTASPKRLSADLARGDISDLLEEMSTNLKGLQDILLSLESTSDSVAATKEAFRRLHAAKGTFSMLELEDIAEFAHQLETVLDYVRTERLDITPDLMDMMLDCVTFLTRAADALPSQVLEPNPELSSRLLERCAIPQNDDRDDGDLIGRTFDISPTIELQMISERKRGHFIYETFFTFVPGRQAAYLVTYLLLRRLGAFGTVLSTLPSVSEIETGQCGKAVKVLWSTNLGEHDLVETLEGLCHQYDIETFQSIPIKRLIGVDINTSRGRF